MPPPPSDRFYETLKPLPAGPGVCSSLLHTPAPADWCVVVADIAGSTAAIGRGEYKQVNLVSTGAIIAVLNRVAPRQIAYIFGGDGATLLVPCALKQHVAAALHGARVMAAKEFGLDMRAGMVDVEYLQKQGASVRVARIETAPGVYQAALSGDGITLAEKLVKGADTAARHDIAALFDPAVLAQAEPDFTGLECRWQPLRSRNGLDVSLIIQACPGGRAPGDDALYEEILAGIHRICGIREKWRPVSESQLQVTSNPEKLLSETRVRTHGRGLGSRLLYLGRVTTLTFVGRACFRFGLKAGNFDGKTYRRRTTENSDYIKFDNALRLVMDITEGQKAELEAYLDNLMNAGRIFYGMHASPSALITCLVFDYDRNHFHFIDGGDGGYALAARQLKQQAARAENPLKQGTG